MENTCITKNPNRIEYYDGIRGIAALLVVACHLTYVFVPNCYFPEFASTQFEQIWHKSFLNVLTNGNAAVHCFFVISGFLVARKIYISEGLKRQDLKNTYTKLVKLVFPAVVFMAILMWLNLLFHVELNKYGLRLDHIVNYNTFEPNLINVISDSFLKTFLYKSSFVGPFWTIRYEFVGTLLIGCVALQNSRSGGVKPYISF